MFEERSRNGRTDRWMSAIRRYDTRPFGGVQSRIVANQTQICLDLAHDANLRSFREHLFKAIRQPFRKRIADHYNRLCWRHLRLVHFAVDPDLVYVTTHLAGPKTRFLPFNRGKFGGAGNPPVPPTQKGYATGYLWEETWSRDSVLDLVRQFIQEVEEEDDKGRKTGKSFLIFPRYQQARRSPQARSTRARNRCRSAVPNPAFCGKRQEFHHRLARPPTLDAPQRIRSARVRLHRCHYGSARPRSPASDYYASI